MKIKDKAAGFVSEYNRDLSVLQEKINETESRLEDLSLEIRFIEEKEIPEAVQRRVLTGDNSQETKIRKQLNKLKSEEVEKSEDLIVLQNTLNKFLQQKANESQSLKQLFHEELRMISQERYKQLLAAKNAYKQAIKTETDILHLYKRIEADLQQIEVSAGRRLYVSTDFSLGPVALNSLALDRKDVVSIAKRLK